MRKEFTVTTVRIPEKLYQQLEIYQKSKYSLEMSSVTAFSQLISDYIEEIDRNVLLSDVISKELDHWNQRGAKKISKSLPYNEDIVELSNQLFDEYRSLSIVLFAVLIYALKRAGTYISYIDYEKEV